MAFGGTNPLMLKKASAAAPADDAVTKSCRFEKSSTSNLNQDNPTPDSARKMTLSFWVKLVESGNVVLMAFGASAAGGGSQSQFDIRQETDGTIGVRSQVNNSYTYEAFTTRLFRDFSSWYHIVIAWDTDQSVAADRVKFYVNGEQETLTGSFPALNYDDRFGETGTNVKNRIGTGVSGTGTWLPSSSYMADIIRIDGQQLTPSSFAEEDATTGQWKPKDTSGLTFGSAGFRLDFEDDTEIGNDVSGEGNDFDGVSNLAASDVVEDTPTDNYCVMNPLDSNSNNVLDEGNLNFSSSGSSGHYPTFSTMGMRSGKWYFEAYKANGSSWMMAIMSLAHDSGSLSMDSTVGNTTSGVNKVGYSISAYNGNKSHDSGSEYNQSYGTATGDVLMCAFDADNGKIWWGTDGTWFASGDPAAGTDYAFNNIDTDTDWGVCIHCYSGNLPWMNFGADPTFGGNVSTPDTSEFKHTPPTGFSALKASALTASIAKPSEHFDIKTWTGTATSPTPAAKVLDFPWSFATDGGLVWQKMRNTTGSHYLFDTVRGDDKALNTNLNDAEQSHYPSYYTQDFDSSGDYSIQQDFDGAGNGNEVNHSSNTYVAWGWKKSAAAGFNIVGWTGDDDDMMGESQTITHGLNPLTPEMIIAKGRTDNSATGSSWLVYHKDLPSGEYLRLAHSDSTITPMSSVIDNVTSTYVDFGSDNSSYYLNYGGDEWTPTDPDTYIGYFFASVEGYSKIGSYEGNLDADGPFIYTGFRPRFILSKNADRSAVHWNIHDAMRDPHNLVDTRLWTNLTSSEDSLYDKFDFYSNGFKPRTADTGHNGNGETIIYYAVAESPFKYANAR